jgi:hypothetical protein
MRGAIPPLPQYAFMAWCLVKHRDNFTFTLMAVAVLKDYSEICIFLSLIDCDKALGVSN